METKVKKIRVVKPKAKQLDKNSPEYLDNLIKSLFGGRQVGSLQDQLPALTTSTDVDKQLYALIGLLFKNFIFNWYPGDQPELTHELVGITAHVTRNLQQRINSFEIYEMLLDDTFTILNLHLEKIRYSKKVATSRFDKSSGDSWADTFKVISTHPALVDPRTQARYLEIVTDCITPLLLPYDEWDSAVAKDIFGDILNGILLKNCVENLSEAYMIWDIIELGCKVIIEKQEIKKEQEQNRYSSFFSTQGISNAIRSLSHLAAYSTSVNVKRDYQGSLTNYAIFPFLNKLLELESKIPLFVGILKLSFTFLTHRGNRLLHNLATNLLAKSILNDAFISNGIKTIRNMYFPGDTVFIREEKFIPKTDAEIEEYRQKCKGVVLKALSLDSLKHVRFMVTETDVDNFLNSFLNKDVNKELVMNLVDLILSKLFPELMEYTENEIKAHSMVH